MVLIPLAVTLFSDYHNVVALASQDPIQRDPSVPYFNPAEYGGSQLDRSAGAGEPLNVIVSAYSSPEVLTKQGILTWARSVGFSEECFGLHRGGPQTANLGDGRGWQNETAVLRWDYGDPEEGTCLETINGGNHFRHWTQSTTGAYFLAVSVEHWLGKHHDIVVDGYDLGRDGLVMRATGNTQYGSNRYTTTSYFVTGLLQPGSDGINHGIPIDGRVAVLTVIKTH